MGHMRVLARLTGIAFVVFALLFLASSGLVGAQEKDQEERTPDVIFVPTPQEVVERMLAANCVVAIVDRADEGDAYGILTFQEIVYRVISRSLAPARVRVGEVMVKPLIVVNPNLRLPFVAQLFANTQIESAPVIEEHRLAGIISSADLVRALVQ